MAGSSLLALIDDIATILDDVATMTKISAQKTSGVLGDDLALNAEQVSGVRADREIPVVLAVAKGSAINKAILVPSALAISQFIPWAVSPLLMLGGLYLCFEGFEKVFHKIFSKHSKNESHVENGNSKEVKNLNESETQNTIEAEKIKGAVRTDFILSAEIIVITLGSVAGANFVTQLSVLVGISFLMTIGVYGLVAGIVKIDDLGLYLCQDRSPKGHSQNLFSQFKVKVGKSLLALAPYLMKTLGIVGTAAMFMVGGGIVVHAWPLLHHLQSTLAEANIGLLKPFLAWAFDISVGVFAGGLVFFLYSLVQTSLRKFRLRAR